MKSDKRPLKYEHTEGLVSCMQSSTGIPLTKDKGRFDSLSSLSEFHQSSQKIKNVLKKTINVVHRDPSPLNSLTTVFHFLTLRGMFIKAIRQRNSRSNCHLLLVSNTVNILNLRWLNFYSSVLGVEGNLPFSIVVIPILILSKLLPLLHSKDSERKPERQSKRRKMDKRLFGYALIWQKTLQICTDMLCQMGGGKPLWTRLSDFKHRFSLPKTLSSLLQIS